MDFDKRLERAINRGEQTRSLRGREQARQQMSEEELRSLHSRYRLDLSDHIEQCLRKLADHFPGFRYQTLVGEEGWGARISRDDFTRRSGQRENVYSRVEMVVRPLTSTHILEVTGKGTIQNKEVFNRAHYRLLAEVDVEGFQELIDLWVVEYAELYAARA